MKSVKVKKEIILTKNRKVVFYENANPEIVIQKNPIVSEVKSFNPDFFSLKEAMEICKIGNRHLEKIMKYIRSISPGLKGIGCPPLD